MCEGLGRTCQAGKGGEGPQDTTDQESPAWCCPSTANAAAPAHTIRPLPHPRTLPQTLSSKKRLSGLPGNLGDIKIQSSPVQWLLLAQSGL